MDEQARKDWREGKTLTRFTVSPATDADADTLRGYCDVHAHGWRIGRDAASLGIKLTGAQFAAEMAARGTPVRGVTREIAWAGCALGSMYAHNANKPDANPEYADHDDAWAARRARIKWQYVKRSPGLWMLGDAMVSPVAAPPDDALFWSLSITRDDWTCEAYTRPGSPGEIAALSNPVRKTTRSKSANRALRKTLGPCAAATGMDVDRLLALVRYVRLAPQSARRMALRAAKKGIDAAEYTRLCADEQARLLEQIAGTGTVEL